MFLKASLNATFLYCQRICLMFVVHLTAKVSQIQNCLLVSGFKKMQTYGITLFLSVRNVAKRQKHIANFWKYSSSTHKTVKIYNPEFWSWLKHLFEHLHPDLRSRVQLKLNLLRCDDCSPSLCGYFDSILTGCCASAASVACWIFVFTH